MIRIAVVGAAGRMGRRITALCSGASDVRIVGALVRAGSPADGEPVPETDGVAYTSDPSAALVEADVVLDFSAPDAGDQVLRACEEGRIPILVGTTGLEDHARNRLEQAAEKTAVLLAPNTSFGVNLLLDLVRRTAAALGEDYDIEIVEAHHRRKVDAPSGTALRLGEEAADARGQDLDGKACYARQGRTGVRPAGEIGFSVIRGGDIAGEHTVHFCGPGERIELTHKASSRDTFASGAINAARWLAGQTAGLYTMNDVLGASAGQ